LESDVVIIIIAPDRVLSTDSGAAGFRRITPFGEVAKMSRRIILFLCMAMAGVCTVAATAGAQDAPPHKNVVSANPFGLLLEFFNAEYERVIGESSSTPMSSTASIHRRGRSTAGCSV
jgi:hypothetical protein